MVRLHSPVDKFPSSYAAVATNSPGRFFAASELKVLLAFIIINYDFKLAGSRMERPDNIYFLDAVIPDPTARLLFKRR